MTIAQLYRCQWQVELFFRWIKQHLRIKAFYGTSENAVKTQVWIAVYPVYVLVAIIKKRLSLIENIIPFYRFSASRFPTKRPSSKLANLNESDSESSSSTACSTNIGTVLILGSRR